MNEIIKIVWDQLITTIEIIKIDWGQLITTIIALIGLYVTLKVNARSMKQILDGSSEWR